MKFIIGAALLILFLSGCTLSSGPLIGSACFNISDDYTLNEKNITFKAMKSSCAYESTGLSALNNYHQPSPLYSFDAEKALIIDRQCMANVNLFYNEIVVSKDNAIYGCNYHYGT